MKGVCSAMPYQCIRIEREQSSFVVRATDPEIAKANRGDGPWNDPEVKYSFETKEQVLAFVEKAIDIALPKDEFSSAFDKIAKEAQGK